MHHVGCMTGPEPYMVQGNIALFLWCTTSVVSPQSISFIFHSGFDSKSIVSELDSHIHRNDGLESNVWF